MHPRKSSVSRAWGDARSGQSPLIYAMHYFGRHQLKTRPAFCKPKCAVPRCLLKLISKATSLKSDISTL